MTEAVRKIYLKLEIRGIGLEKQNEEQRIKVLKRGKELGLPMGKDEIWKDKQVEFCKITKKDTN